MYGYKIKKNGAVPRIVFACKATMERYDWHNTNSSETIEFSAARSGRRTLKFSDGHEEIIEGETFDCIVGNDPMHGTADNGVAVEVVTVAATFDGLSYEPKVFEAEDIADKDAILLPLRTEGLSEERMAYFKNILYRTIECRSDKSAASEMMCAANIFTLMYELDRIARQGITPKKDKYRNYYVTKTESIILGRYAEKITIRSIAKELDITPNYLSAIFKASAGVGFAERLLEVRVRKAEELIKEGRLSTAEIAQQVGYEDESHLRRRFKQYYGISIHDFRLISREMTLYHKKPTRNDEA